MTSCKDPNEAFSLYEEAKLRMSEGGFKLRKWKTSDEMLFKKVLESEHEGQSNKSSVGIHQEKEDSNFYSGSGGSGRDGGKRRDTRKRRDGGKRSVGGQRSDRGQRSEGGQKSAGGQ